MGGGSGRENRDGRHRQTMVEGARHINAFYAHEKLRPVPPCREGPLWMKKIHDAHGS